MFFPNHNRKNNKSKRSINNKLYYFYYHILGCIKSVFHFFTPTFTPCIYLKTMIPLYYNFIFLLILLMYVSKVFSFFKDYYYKAYVLYAYKDYDFKILILLLLYNISNALQLYILLQILYKK